MHIWDSKLQKYADLIIRFLMPSWIPVLFSPCMIPEVAMNYHSLKHKVITALLVEIWSLDSSQADLAFSHFEFFHSF